jgi:hypothetical protein
VIGHPLRASPDVFVVLGIGAYAGNCKQPFELRDIAIFVGIKVGKK